MASYGVDTLDRVQKNLLGDHPPVFMPITVLSGQVLSRGHVLGIVTASGFYAGYDADLADGRENAVVILAEDVDATGGNEPCIAYCHGAFQAVGLSWDDETNDAAAGILALYAVGIFCK